MKEYTIFYSLSCTRCGSNTDLFLVQIDNNKPENICRECIHEFDEEKLIEGVSDEGNN